MVDRDVQRHKTFTGIEGINTQDYANAGGDGPICDRTETIPAEGVPWKQAIGRATNAFW